MGNKDEVQQLEKHIDTEQMMNTCKKQVMTMLHAYDEYGLF